MFEDAKADLQSYRDLRKQRLEEAFWSTVGNNVKADSGNVDIKNKRIILPSGSLQNKDSLWNEYVKAAEAKGIHPSYTQFSENYAMAKDFDNQKIEKIINTAKALGFKDRDVKASLADDPAGLKRLENLFLSGSPETQSILAPYLKTKPTITQSWTEFGKDINELIGNYPKLTSALLAGGVGVGAYKGGKAIINKAKDLTGKGTPKPKVSGPKTTTINGVKVPTAKLNEHYRKLHAVYKKRREGKKTLNFNQWIKTQNKDIIKKNISSDQLKEMAKDLSKPKPKAKPTLKSRAAKNLDKLKKLKIKGVPVGQILNAAVYLNMAKDIGTSIANQE